MSVAHSVGHSTQTAHPQPAAAEPAAPGVQAGTLWGAMVFGTPRPSSDVLAHEMVHALQAERFGSQGVVGSRTKPDADDEVEARALAPLVGAGEPVTVRARPTAAMQLFTPQTLEQDAADLRRSLSRNDSDRVIDILAAHYAARTIPELRAEYGLTLFRDLMRGLVGSRRKTLWSLVRTYLGDQLTLDERIDIDRAIFGAQAEQVIAEIQGMSDEQALRIVVSEDPFPPVLAVDVSDTAQTDAGPAAPAASLAAVRASLAAALHEADFYRAMHLLYLKAGRANKDQWSQSGAWQIEVARNASLVIDLTPGARSGPLAFEPPADMFDVPVSEPDEDLFALSLLGDAVGRHRIDLSVEQVVAADEATTGTILVESQPRFGAALLAVAVLPAADRRVVWARLAGRHWVGFSDDQVEKLHRLALFPDDALVLERAVIEAHKEGYSYAPEMATAATAAQEIIGSARRRSLTAPDPEQRETASARAERADAIFGRSIAFQNALGTYQEGPAQLVALGADPMLVALQQLRGVEKASDLFALVSSLPAERRTSERFGFEVRHRARERLGFDDDQMRDLEAYLSLGSDPDAFNRVALHEMRTAVSDTEPGRVLSVMHRMKPEVLQAFVQWEPYRQWYGDLFQHPGTRQLWVALAEANRGNTQEALRLGALQWNGLLPGAPPTIRDKGAYAEWLSARGDKQVDRRKGFVLWSQVQRDKGTEATLTPEEKKAVEAYAEHRRLTEDLSWAEREHVDEVYFGQPQLVATAESSLDATSEADYMFERVAARRKLTTSWRTIADDVRQWRGEYLGHDVTEFLLTYGHLRAGVVSQSDLAVLGDLYHRAMRETDEIKQDQDMAALMASIVGCVVAIVVVTVLTGGTMSGFAIAAVAALAGGVAAATAGALIRPESTGWEVLRDFGTGAVEGAMAVAGAGIAARVVRAMGLASEVAAGAAAADAVELSTGAKVAGHIAQAVIDGSVSGASGEVFRTATDEATWDRSWSEAFARVLAALARGGAQGAKGGFLVGGGIAVAGGLLRVARRLGEPVALRTADLLESSGIPLKRFNDLAPASQDALATATRLAAEGDVAGAQRLLAGTELTAEEIGRILPGLRSMHVAEAALETGLDRAEIQRRLEVVEPKEFAKRAGGQRGNAVIEFREDGPYIVMRSDVDPLVVREETHHIAQWLHDPAMQQRMKRIQAMTDVAWKGASSTDRAALVIDKLEVEADAQRRIIADLEAQAASGDIQAEDQIAAAEDTLRSLNAELRDTSGSATSLAAADLAKAPRPRLFSKDPPTRGAEPTAAKNWKKVESSGVLHQDPVAVEKKLNKLGYRLEKTAAGRAKRIVRPGGATETDEMAKLTVVETEAGPVVEAGRPRLTWAERRADAAAKLKRVSGDVASLEAQLASGSLTGEAAMRARRAIAKSPQPYLDELQRRVTAGTLDPEAAGMLSEWGGVVEAMRGRTRRSYAQILDKVDTRSGPLTEAMYDDFRRTLRRMQAEDVAELASLADQRKALDDLLALQPDSKSKGELFSAYLSNRIRSAGPRHVLDVPFESPLRASTRQPDEVALSSDLDDLVPSGTYGMEHKTGPGAFKIDQAEGYARSLNAPGGAVSTTGERVDWDGVVYLFGNKTEAESAMADMLINGTVRPLLGKPKGGIHVLYLDGQGRLQRFAAGTGGARP